MATNKSQFLYSGKIGNTRGYGRIRTDKKFIGLPGGPTLLEFQTRPSLLRMRQNASESGACFMAAEQLNRLLFYQYFSKSCNATKGQIVNTLKALIQTDTVNPVGQRSIQFDGSAAEYMQAFNQKCYSYANFNSVLNIPYTIDFNLVFKSFGITFSTPINQANFNVIPKGATAYKIAIRVSLFPNLVYSPTVQKYLWASDINYFTAQSGFIDMNIVQSTPFNLVLTLVDPIPSNYGVFLTGYFAFYQKISGHYNLLHQLFPAVILKYSGS